MPRVQGYQAKRAPDVPGMPGIAGARAPLEMNKSSWYSSFAEALGNLGEAAIKMYNKRKEFDENAWALEATSALKRQSLDMYNKQIQNSKPGAFNFAQDVNQGFRSTYDQIRGSAPSERARAIFDQHAMQFGDALFGQAINHEAQEYHTFKYTNIMSGIEDDGNMIRNFPVLYQSTVAARKAEIEAAQLNYATTSRLTTEMQEVTSEAKVLGDARVNVGIALQMLQSGAYRVFKEFQLSSARQERIEAQLINQLESEKRAGQNALDMEMADRIARFGAGALDAEQIYPPRMKKNPIKGYEGVGWPKEEARQKVSIINDLIVTSRFMTNLNEGKMREAYGYLEGAAPLSPLRDRVQEAIVLGTKNSQIPDQAVAGIFRAESEGLDDPHTVGRRRAGNGERAQGLWQTLPVWLKTEGVPEGVQYDPVAMVPYVVKFLDKMMDKYGGNMEKALLAYHEGPAKVDRIVAEHPEDYTNWVSEEGKGWYNKVMTTPFIRKSNASQFEGAKAAFQAKQLEMINNPAQSAETARLMSKDGRELTDPMSITIWRMNWMQANGYIKPHNFAVLSDDEAKGAVQSIMAQDSPRHQVEAYQQFMGSYSFNGDVVQQVHADLVKEGLPNNISVASQLYGQMYSDQIIPALLGEVTTANVPAERVREAYDVLNNDDSYNTLIGALYRQGSYKGQQMGQELGRALVTAMVQPGISDPSNEITKAIEKLVDERYILGDGYTVDAQQLPRGVNRTDVQSLLNDVQYLATKTDKFPEFAFTVPESDKRFSPEFLERVISSGDNLGWRNTPEGNGVELGVVWPGTNEFLPLNNKAGERMRIYYRDFGYVKGKIDSSGSYVDAWWANMPSKGGLGTWMSQGWGQ
jgi:hypothetical protein